MSIFRALGSLSAFHSSRFIMPSFYGKLFQNTRSFSVKKCDPFAQDGIPLTREQADLYLSKLNGWNVLNFPSSKSNPEYIPNYHPDSKMKEGNGTQWGSNKENVCSGSSEKKEKAVSCGNPNCCQVEKSSSPVTASGDVKFKGGLVLRREFRFKHVNMGLDFVDQIRIMQENLGHVPHRVIMDASRGYGHVMVELYTPFLAGLSYNDFSFALALDTVLKNYMASKKS